MNAQQDRPAGTASSSSLGIGTFFRLLAAPILVASLLLGSNEAGAAQAVVSGEFVGAIPNADPRDPPGGPADELVAVAVYDPSPTGARRIRIYICDSEQLSPAGDAEWFTGTITGDAFNFPLPTATRGSKAVDRDRGDGHGHLSRRAGAQLSRGAGSSRRRAL